MSRNISNCHDIHLDLQDNNKHQHYPHSSLYGNLMNLLRT